MEKDEAAPLRRSKRSQRVMRSSGVSPYVTAAPRRSQKNDIKKKHDITKHEDALLKLATAAFQKTLRGVTEVNAPTPPLSADLHGAVFHGCGFELDTNCPKKLFTAQLKQSMAGIRLVMKKHMEPKQKKLKLRYLALEPVSLTKHSGEDTFKVMFKFSYIQ